MLERLQLITLSAGTKRYVNGSAASGAANSHALDQISRLVWRAHAEGHIGDADAGAASEAIEARRATLAALPSPARGEGTKSVSGLPRASQHSPPRGDIDAVAHEIAVGIRDNVAQMNPDAELDASLGRQAGVALDHASLNLDRATHGVDQAAELDDAAVAGALNDAALMRGDSWVDQVAAKPLSRERVRSSSAPTSRL